MDEPRCGLPDPCLCTGREGCLTADDDADDCMRDALAAVLAKIDVTRYRLTVRGTAGETLEIRTGEVSTAAGKITVPLTFRDTASIEIEWHAEVTS